MGEVGRRWRRTPHDEAVFGGPGGQAMWSVAAGGPGLVAVGRDAGPGAAAVWTSPDGVVWQRVTHDEAVFGGPGNQVMSSVAAGGPGLVAVGRDEDQDGDWVAAVWISTDGVVWQRVAHDETVFGGPGRQAMWSVAAGGPGLVAVGAAVGQDRDWAAAVWTSPDGVVWQRVAHDETVFGGPGNQEMDSVAAGGPGLVAVGRDEDQDGDWVAAVWISTDGVVWQRVAHDETVFGGPGNQVMLSVAAGGPGLVAVGAAVGQGRGPDGGRAAAVWTSPDGAVWQRVAHDAAVFGDGAMWSVAAGGPGLVAVGNYGWPPRAAVWVSP